MEHGVSHVAHIQDEWGNTALSLACEGGHVETARILLDHGANVDYQNKVMLLYLNIVNYSLTNIVQQSMANQLFGVQALLVRQNV